MTVRKAKGLTDGAMELRGPGYGTLLIEFLVVVSFWDGVVTAEGKIQVALWTFMATTLSLGTVLRFCNAREWRKPACLVRLDATGITVYGHALVPWTEVAEVRARPNCVLFFAPTGQDLPLFPRPARSNPRDAANARFARAYGRVLVIDPNIVDVPCRQIVAAVRELTAGTVPVTQK